MGKEKVYVFDMNSSDGEWVQGCQLNTDESYLGD